MILQNTLSGDVAVWLMNGLTIQVGAVIATISTNWRIGGSTDLNADGRDDLVLLNESTGDVALWGMNGITIQYGAILTTLPPGWRLAMQPR